VDSVPQVQRPDARLIAVIIFPVQPFDNGSNPRIDIDIPQQRAVAR
jgi:hypothetical protein